MEGSINGKSISIPDNIEDYDQKNGIPTLYNIDGIELEEDDIFVKDINNGINRDIKTGKVDNDSLFKQISYRLNDKFYDYEYPLYDNNRKIKKDEKGKNKYDSCQYSFAFYAELDMDDFNQYDRQLVTVGGDNSQFVIRIQSSPIPNYTKETNGTKIVLTSPSYISNLENVRFAISDTIPFKCMKTDTNSVEAYNKQNKIYNYQEKLMLYTAGSVFYVDEERKKLFIDEILKHKDFRQIGYNFFEVK